MLVFEYKCRICFVKNMSYDKVAEAFSYFIDSALGQQEEYLKFHESREYKYYCFDLPYPCEIGKSYYSKKIYTVRIRTIRQDLAEYFSKVLPFQKTNEITGMGGELNLLPQKCLDSVFALTPIVIKNDFGYWKSHMTLPEYEQRLKTNLIKKYNLFTNQKLDESFQLYELLEFKNQKPVKINYKGISLLGDKINFVTAKNSVAQQLWYFALGVGLGENNARGCGYLNYRYL